MTKTFLITGASAVLRRSFAREALAAGHRASATVRQAHHQRLLSTAPGCPTSMLLDITADHEVEAVVQQAEEEVGPRKRPFLATRLDLLNVSAHRWTSWTK
ncbi:hypothetical protein ACIP2X_08690 [Streptomyces sp. NPDC089424]|uniref:hypothetical protein n=1 Tax=Streptomyces sp. NPDC089424 TaxID=3365917 RepID=UPI00382E4ABC